MLTQFQMELPQRFWDKVDKTSSENGCWLWMAGCNKDGYGRFSLNNKMYLAHRLTLAQHLGRPLLQDMCSTHQCPGGPNRKCCNPSHLKEATHADNEQDKIRDGNSTRGKKNPKCKLTEAQVLEIRASDKSQNELAQIYNVARTTVSQIKTGISWSWLQNPKI
jgi:DNA-binding CsgD family transcriptional regulator